MTKIFWLLTKDFLTKDYPRTEEYNWTWVLLCFCWKPNKLWEGNTSKTENSGRSPPILLKQQNRISSDKFFCALFLQHNCKHIRKMVSLCTATFLENVVILRNSVGTFLICLFFSTFPFTLSFSIFPYLCYISINILRNWKLETIHNKNAMDSHWKIMAILVFSYILLVAYTIYHFLVFCVYL